MSWSLPTQEMHCAANGTGKWRGDARSLRSTPMEGPSVLLAVHHHKGMYVGRICVGEKYERTDDLMIPYLCLSVQ